jgi:putative endonuclease
VSDDRKSFGAQGEEQAALYLESRGLRVLERGYRCVFGEADLIARDGETVVFVEVKRRSCADYGPAECAVDRRKQQHLIKTALHWLQARGLSDVPVRFDVVALQEGSLRHIPSAFSAEGWTR